MHSWFLHAAFITLFVYLLQWSHSILSILTCIHIIHIWITMQLMNISLWMRECKLCEQCATFNVWLCDCVCEEWRAHNKWGTSKYKATTSYLLAFTSLLPSFGCLTVCLLAHLISAIYYSIITLPCTLRRHSTITSCKL